MTCTHPKKIKHTIRRRPRPSSHAEIVQIRRLWKSGKHTLRALGARFDRVPSYIWYVGNDCIRADVCAIKRRPCRRVSDELLAIAVLQAQINALREQQDQDRAEYRAEIDRLTLTRWSTFPTKTPVARPS